MSNTSMSCALVIALRYAGARRQFNASEDPSDPELPILEYPLQQFRLFPYLAYTFVQKHSALLIHDAFYEFTVRMTTGEKSDDLVELSREFHALSCVSKPMSSWTTQRCIQETREACGGHGYLNVNRFGKLRNDNDPACTYEGDNNVLLQQTSNYLLSLLDVPESQRKSPLGSIDFLKNYSKILKHTSKDVHSTSLACRCLHAYEWLVCHLLGKCSKKANGLNSAGYSNFDVRNNNQVYLCHTLAIVFYERTLINNYLVFIEDQQTPNDFKPVLMNLVDLMAAHSLEKHLSTLYIGGYCHGSTFGESLRTSIVGSCTKLKPDAIALVDIFAPPDFILNAAIGKADGNIYANLWNCILETPDVLSRPSWWQQFVEKPNIGSRLTTSKL